MTIFFWIQILYIFQTLEECAGEAQAAVSEELRGGGAGGAGGRQGPREPQHHPGGRGQAGGGEYVAENEDGKMPFKHLI